MLTKLPAAYCPSTIVAIDDDRLLLNSLQLRIGENRPLKLFESPQEALTFLTKTYKGNNFSENCISYSEDDYAEHRSLDVNIKMIQDIVYHPERFAQIGVVIVDFSMPGMNGDELASALKGSSFNVLMLTGEAQHQLATNLFNSGLIKSFIRKDQTDLFSILPKMVRQLELQYFINQTRTIVDSIIKKSEKIDYLPLSCLNDPIFCEYFSKIVTENEIVEYYLIETSGSFVMLDIDANLSWLLVKDLGDMAALEDMYFFDQPNVPDTLKQKILLKQVLLHVFNEAIFDEKAWMNQLYPCTKISGQSDYFCSYVTTPLMPTTLKISNIKSYQDYLQQP